MWRLGPDRLLWSTSADLPGAAQEGRVVELLAQPIAIIGRADGLITAAELSDVQAGQDSGSYHCLLLYHRYRKERLDSARGRVEGCIAQGLAADDNNAALHAAAADMALVELSRPASGAAAYAKALLSAQRHAQIATAIEPLNAWANITLARVALTFAECPRATRNARRAAELDSYDPSLLSDAGIVLLGCGDRRAEILLRRAIALDDGPEGRFYQPLVLLAIDRNDPAMARDALARMVPPMIGRRPRFYLISAAGYAMIGDRRRARIAWSLLLRIDSGVAHDPAAFFAAMGITGALRDKAMAQLRQIAPL